MNRWMYGALISLVLAPQVGLQASRLAGQQEKTLVWIRRSNFSKI